ncbi:phytoene/squalene synthase family protein [Agrococcus baldri]|uniref:Phytoene synthase n=1 Tax=Agrococcus baldri TaxID=153730 RepID=A0AA87RBZ8_9MICO|nr:phytoene/squalene synthase family protein [Agrococcus baldri]GEK80031.1 phytoene synthase [Agrococcus baldri]
MTGLAAYTATARRASGEVIASYSTSFGLASRLLPPTMRGDIGTVYALVRVADEIVDGPGAESGLDAAACHDVLDALEREVERALATGFSADLIVHAFAETARRVGITSEQTAPFFAAMRRDLQPVAFADERELRAYVYGSAEVIGVMCVHCFLGGARLPEAEATRVVRGARALGSAFQVVNFLRDLGADATGLGRAYLPGVDPMRPSDEAVQRVLERLEGELRVARSAVELLPREARPAVIAAHDIFAALGRRIRDTPAAQLPARRISVPSAQKAAIVARAALSAGLGRATAPRTRLATAEPAR